MLEDKVNTLFRDSTDMYCQGNYAACLALLSDCLALESDRSILYSNRSIAYYHLKQLENSFEDLELSLRANHLNYIAYFNLFSLHFLNGNHAQSFKNLCLCLSSAYTILCRCQPTLELAEHSIFYSFNNKQSLFLKAILIYQKSQLRASLQLLRRIQQLENNVKNREIIFRHIHSIEAQLGMPLSKYEARANTGSWYILETSVVQPQAAAFEGQLSKMLKEFNEVYRKINEEMQMAHELNQNSSSSLSQQVRSEAEEDKEIYRVTTYNSTSFSRNIEHEDQRSAINLSQNKELKLLSIITDQIKNHHQTQKSNTVFDHAIYPLRKADQKVKFFIEQCRLNMPFEERDKLRNIYAILRYKQGEKYHEHRTSIIESNRNICLKWYEWTDDLILTPQASQLDIKILNKRYTAFKDDLLAEGQIQISKSGSMSIPLFQRHECNGLLAVSVETE